MGNVLELTPSLPSNFLDLCYEIFPWTEYLFVWRDEYKRKRAYCTGCNSEFSIDINEMRTVTPKDILLYSQKHNDICTCSRCGKTLIYKDKWRGRGKLWEENYLYYFQALPDGGIVLRTFYLHKSFEWKIRDVKIEYSEHQRVYYYHGKCYRFQRYPNSGIAYLNFCDWYNAEIVDAEFTWRPIKEIRTPKPWMGRMYGNFKGGFNYAIHNDVFKGNFKYSCLKEYLSYEKRPCYKEDYLLTVVEYLELFQKNPSLIEKMIKQGFKELLHEHFQSQRVSAIINFRKPDVYSATKLSKGTIRGLKTITAKDIFFAQLKEVYNISPKNAAYIFCHDIRWIHDVIVWAKRIKKEDSTKLNQQIKYYRKQKITHFNDYTDYLEQLKQLNMPLTDENLFPYDFKAAHDSLTVELNRRANAKKKAAAKRQQKVFEEKYKELLSKLYFEDNEFVIRPARGDAELLEESNVLSHCVYSNYRQKYRALQTIICVIRKKSEQNKPFYTLEINPGFTRIIQCRGKANCGTTKEVEAFKNKWFHWLQSGHKEEQECQKTA